MKIFLTNNFPGLSFFLKIVNMIIIVLFIWLVGLLISLIIEYLRARKYLKKIEITDNGWGVDFKDYFPAKSFRRKTFLYLLHSLSESIERVIDKGKDFKLSDYFYIHNIYLKIDRMRALVSRKFLFIGLMNIVLLIFGGVYEINFLLDFAYYHDQSMKVTLSKFIYAMSPLVWTAGINFFLSALGYYFFVRIIGRFGMYIDNIILVNLKEESDRKSQ